MKEGAQPIASRAAARPGFTIIELLIVLMVGALLAGLVGPAVASVQKELNLDNASIGVVTLGSRARAYAANRGATAILRLDPGADRITIRMDDDTLSDGRLDLDDSYATDMTLSDGGSTLDLCYTARGFVETSCLGGSRLPVDVILTRGGKSDTVRIMALGQVERVD